MLQRKRLETVLANMARLGLPQIIVSDSYALRYLLEQDIEPMERCAALVIRDDGDVHAFMNKLFCFVPTEGVTLHEYGDGEDVYAMIAEALKPGKVGFDKEWPTRHTLGVLEKRSDLIPVLGSAPVDEARMYKDAAEKTLLRAAGVVNDRAVAYGIGSIGAQLTEAQLAKRIDDFFLANGGKQVGQYQIACYGANAAQPHHVPDDTTVKPGDAVLLDLFYPIHGYWCDMTRTVFYQKVSEQHRQVYEIVRSAQQAGIDFVKPGVRMCDIDAAVRKVITDAGYGDAFITRTGHGIGMTVHEPPDVSANCAIEARPGMVFSIEPGIYLPGDVGVRIEDLVLVTDTGCEVLTRYPKELQIVGE